MGSYARLADLPVVVERWSTTTHVRETAGGDDRRTTVYAAEGAGHVGRGEDVTYDPEGHAAVAERPPMAGLTGDRSLDVATARLDGVDLFPAGDPERAVFRNYRRWAAESALLDLALRQADTDVSTVLDRSTEPVRFVVSTGLGDPASADRVVDWLAVDPVLSFKVDLTRPVADAVIDRLVGTGSVDSVDLKARYADEAPTTDDGSTPAWVGEPDPEPGFYRDLLGAFPEAVFEDPAVTDRTRPVLEPERGRLAWDVPVHSLDEFDDQPLDVGWCNVKSSRFGTLEALFGFLDAAGDRGLALYGGGQYELSVGRGQLHALAAMFYPDGPNDIAPRGYNDPEPRHGLSTSPLDPPEPTPGFGWRPGDPA